MEAASRELKNLARTHAVKRYDKRRMSEIQVAFEA
jgi:hypothetical protein